MVARTFEGIAHFIIAICIAIAALLIISSSDALARLLHGSASIRVNLISLALFAISLWAVKISGEHLRRFTIVIFGATIAALALMYGPETTGVIGVVLCSGIITIVLWSVMQKWQPKSSTRASLKILTNPWLMISVLALIYTVLSLLYYISLHHQGIDLAIFTQEVYKYAHFQGLYNSIKDQNIFADHFSPFLMLLAPLWWLWPGASMLIVVQVVALCVGGWVVYKIAESLIKDRLVAWSITAAYLLAPSLQAPMQYDFHEIIFFSTALLLLFYFQIKQKYWAYWITFALALLIKEDVALYLMAWSLFFGCFSKQWKPALTGISISLIYFLVVMKAVIPHYTGSAMYQYFDMGPLGATPLEVIKTSLSHPTLLLRQFFLFDTKQHPGFPPDIKIFTQLSLLASFGFLPLLAPTVLILAAPILIEQFLLDFPYHWGLAFHYSTPITPVLAIATIIALSRIPTLLQRFKLTRGVSGSAAQRLLAIFVITSAVAYNIHQRTFITNIVRPSTYTIGSSERQALTLARTIPANASVATNSFLAPHLAGRTLIITWPGFYGEGGKPEFKNKPLNTDYVVLSAAVPDWVWRLDESVDHMNAVIHDHPEYGLIALSDDSRTMLAKRGAASDPALVKRWDDIKNSLVIKP